MEAEPTHYELLGVSPTASVAEIKSAFRQQVMRNHPDQGGNPVFFRMLEEAYEVLISPARRVEYDESLAVNVGEGTPPHGVRVTAPVGDAYGEGMVFIDHGDTDHRREGSWWEGKPQKKRITGKRILLGLVAVWLVLTVLNASGVATGVGGWTLVWAAFWLMMAWIFGSFVLRLFGWVTAIFAFADAYLNDVDPGVTAARLVMAFAIWLCGQWLYTWKKGRWHSVVAHQILTHLPGRLRPDRRWDMA